MKKCFPEGARPVVATGVVDPAAPSWEEGDEAVWHVKYKDGDEGRHIFHAETTDRLLVFGSNGRFYTLSVSNLPGGRGMGEPVRLMVDLPNETEVIAMFPWREGRKYLVASKAGNGFIVDAADILAQTKTGKQVLNGVRIPLADFGGVDLTSIASVSLGFGGVTSPTGSVQLNDVVLQEPADPTPTRGLPDRTPAPPPALRLTRRRPES